MAIKFSQFNERTDHTSGMYLVGYDGNQNIHITVDNLFDDFINGTENTITMFGTGGAVLADSILSQNAEATILTVAGQLNVDAAATFDTSITVTGASTLNGNVTLGNASTDLITQTGTLYLNGPVKDTTDTLGVVDQVLLSNAVGELTFTDLADLHVGGAEVVELPVKNVQGSALVKGDPVYISGSVGASGKLEVQLADASNTLKMPAVGLLKQDLANNAEGFAVVTGKLRNLITDPIDGVNPTENDIIYVKPSGTSGAALTTTKPVYSNFIQNIGKAGRVSTSNDGNLVVSSILRTNDIPNLTPGRLWVGSAGNTIESQTLFVDEANSRLGVGTTSPSRPLTIESAATSIITEFKYTAAGYSSIDLANTSGSARISSINNDLALSPSGAEKVRITSTGNVGIGTTTPARNLHIHQNDSTLSYLQITNSTTGASGSDGVSFGITSDEVAVWNNRENTATTISTNNTERIRVSSAGNVGIGTTSPGYKLDVQNTGSGDLANFETSGTSGIRIANSNTSFATRIISLNTETSLKSDGNIAFFTDGSASGSGIQRMIIENSSGDVGIGTDPSFRLHVKDDVNQIAQFESTGEKSQIGFKTSAASNNQAYLAISTPASTPGKRRVTLGPSNNTNSRDVLKIENQLTRTYSDNHMNFGGTGVASSAKFTVNSRWDTADNDNYNTFTVDADLAGATALTGDRTVTGVNVDMDSTATGGNQSQELTLKGINVDVANKTSGDANHIYGVFSYARNTRTGTGDNQVSITGGYFQAYNSAQTGLVSNMYGLEAITYIEDATHTVNNAYGVYGRTTIDNAFGGSIAARAVGGYFVTQVETSNDGLVTSSVGLYAENEISSNVATIRGVQVINDINANVTADTAYLFQGDVQKASGVSITHNWGIHVTNSDKNKLDGTLQLPTYGQGNVTGTATKNLAVDSNGNVIETDGGVVDGSGTANYVSKWSDPNTLTDSVIYDNGTNVGIGTTSPSAKLHAEGDGSIIRLQNNNSDANGTFIDFRDSNGTRTGYVGTTGTSDDMFLYTQGAKPIRFHTNATERMHIDSSGDVGIGTTTPGEKLHVDGNIRVQDSTDTIYSNRFRGINNADVELRANNGYDLILNGSSGDNVGIGTASPLFKLDVDGDVRVSQPSKFTFANGQYLKDDGSAGLDIASISGTGSINFITNSTDKMIITSAGSVGIGTTSPSSPLTVKSNSTSSGNSGLRIEANGSTDAIVLIGEKSGNKARFHMYNAGVEKIAFYTDGTDNHISEGNVGIGTTSPRTKLDVVNGSSGQSYSNVSGVLIDVNGTSNSYYGLRVGSNTGNNHLCVTNAGKVGIGTASPGEKLTISSDNPIVKIHDSNSTTRYAAVNFATAGGSWFLSSGDNATSGTSSNLFITRGNDGTSNRFIFHRDGYYFGVYDNTNTIKTVIRANGDSYFNGGDLGVGTTSPGYKLDVNGDGRINGVTFVASGATRKISTHSNSGQLQLNGGTDSSGGAYINVNGSGFSLGRMTLYSPESIYLNSNVGIGTALPVSKLDVNGGIRMADDSSTASASNVGTLKYYTSGNNSYVDMCMQTGATTYAWVNIVQNNW